MKITTVSVCVVCGILPLMILPVLPDTWILAVLFCLACLLCLIPHHYARYAALTLLFFMWGIFAARQAIWAGNVLPAATQEATVVITATDHMTTHYGRITHLRGKPLFPAVGIVLHGQYLPMEVCAGQQWAMTLKVRAVHGQLNEGGFDSQRYALAQHQPLTGRFLQAKAINPECSLRGRYLASLRATLAPYPWQQVILALGMGERGAVSQEVKAVMRDTGTAHLMASSGLLFWYQWFPAPNGNFPRGLRWLLNLLHLQAGITLLLLPLQVALFHGISVTAMLANLFAVPWVTFVTVPLILAGMILHLTGPFFLEEWVWYLTDRALAALFYLLNALPQGWVNIDNRWQWLTFLPWLMLIAWRLNVWRTWPVVCLCGLLLMSWPLWRPINASGWQVHMLDVGQGLAIAIVRGDKVILYDTGRAWPEGDSGQQVIIPWLRWHNLTPEGVILSHEHLDHRGGLRSLQRVWPSMWIRSPLGWQGHLPCFRGEQWQWQGLTFQAHWPLRESADRGNNLSCVVKVDDGVHSILLTGDIEAGAEQKMLSRYWRHLAATFIQVPHHGSNTSSSIPFIQRVHGEAALASASRYNAWRLPSRKVKQRYRQQAYQWFDTPHQGQISLLFSPQGWRIQGLRDQILPRWYHQWFGVSEDNG
ncbi:DNA internalization-related competence protein ComEC/Rec2 [Salmonella enterica]|nr:DNA internalization-related competence protein ComEC/Rec2 [Salmonella enterica]